MSTMTEKAEWCIVNFYHLVDVPNPKQVRRKRCMAGTFSDTGTPRHRDQQLVEEHRTWLEHHGPSVTGRIYFSSQGVNAQFGGLKTEALAYTELLQADSLFKDLRFSVWPASGSMYPKLRLKYKPNLISLAGGMERLPVTEASNRATPLAPPEWKQMIAQAEERKAVVLDVRNGYEWDAGHFDGAERPAEEVFSETPVSASLLAGGCLETRNTINDHLAAGWRQRRRHPAASEGRAARNARHDVLYRWEARCLPPKPKALPLLLLASGGIRCDVYSTFLRSKGFQNLYTLEGGIQVRGRRFHECPWSFYLVLWRSRGAHNDIKTLLHF